MFELYGSGGRVAVPGNEGMKAGSKGNFPGRCWVFGIPFLISSGLTAMTVGGKAYWQDSGLFLSAVHEMGVIYPPGFVLYLLLCKAWTLAWFWMDFTLAVNLFSAFCSALAAGTLGLGARTLLLARGPIFNLGETSEKMAGLAGMMAGCLAASGYTFWFSAIYAKGYALYYLILALLLYWMIRADGSRKPGDFTVVASLIGLAWAAHPSSALLGGALSAYVVYHWKVVGWKGAAWRTLVAAGFAISPSLLLPVLAAREPEVMLGNPRDVTGFFQYLLGTNFITFRGAFGFESSRWISGISYFWEEMLGIGLLVVLLGIGSIVIRNRAMALGLAAWMLPISFIALLFKMEGQLDHWLVAAWIPLYGAAAVGFREISVRSGKRACLVILSLGAIGVAWSIRVNTRDLRLRDYDLAEAYGRCLLDRVQEIHPKAIVILEGDDALALCSYLKLVRGMYTGLLLVDGNRLEEGATGWGSWYDRLLRKKDPGLQRPDYMRLRWRCPGRFGNELPVAAFASANVAPERPIFFSVPPAEELIRPDYRIMPAGALWKMVPRDAEGMDPRYWGFPVRPDQVFSRMGRPRGQWISISSGAIKVRPEPYEDRLRRLMVQSTVAFANGSIQEGRIGLAREALKAALEFGPDEEEVQTIVFKLAGCQLEIGEYDRAEALLRKLMAMKIKPAMRAGAHVLLSDILRHRGQMAESGVELEKAQAVPGLDGNSRRNIAEQCRERSTP